MFEIRRTPAARAAEQAMPESLSVAFGACLDEIADDPWAAGEAWGSSAEDPVRVGTFGFDGRGMVLYRVNADANPPHVLVAQLIY